MEEKSEISSLENLSKQKIFREIENIRRDTEIKTEELNQKFWLKNSVIGAVGGLIVLVFSQFFSTCNQNRQHKLSQELDRKKYKAEILIKAFDGKDTTETKKRILFLIDNHLIDDPNDTLRRAANKPETLPSNTPTFNENSLMPTVTITNASLFPCNSGDIDGCWQTSERGRPGDVIAIQVLFRNTSNVPSENTKIIIRPSRTKVFNQLVFRSSVSSNGFKTAIGEATLKILSPKQLKVALMLNGAEWFSSENQLEGYPVSENDLLSVEQEGVKIGTIPPGKQGVLIARFLIANY